MVKILLVTEGTLLSGAFLVLFLFSFYAMFRAAANRSLGVPYLTALNGLVLLFPDSSYTPVGVKWCKVWRNSLVGALACIPLAFFVNYITLYALKAFGFEIPSEWT